MARYSMSNKSILGSPPWKKFSVKEWMACFAHLDQLSIMGTIFWVPEVIIVPTFDGILFGLKIGGGNGASP